MPESNSKKPYIAAVSGSMRETSSNTRVLLAATSLLQGAYDIRLSDHIQTLPPFNPDSDHDHSQAPLPVKQWRQFIAEASAVMICTPEYAAGIPGSLKNALDWLVSSGEFVNKPTAAISASPGQGGGSIALASLAGTLRIMTATLPDNCTHSIAFVSKKLTATGVDPETETELQQLATNLSKLTTTA
ncbi:MAG: NAD(P)H-dependent oxidoreductase [Bacteroidetes bacterium]|nr:NAD(P)H-dependent oxidoreductase [Bacteroidota bacterium]